jgi:hypothetical protein
MTDGTGLADSNSAPLAAREPAANEPDPGACRLDAGRPDAVGVGDLDVGVLAVGQEEQCALAPSGP